MTDEKIKDSYSEVYSILNILGNQYIEKIPKSIYMTIEKEKNNDYNPQYDLKIDISKQNIKRDSIAIIAFLHLNYWCETIDEKNKLKKIFMNNEAKYQEKLKQKYNCKNLFNKVIKEEAKEEVNITRVSFIDKIINKIRSFF